MRAHTTSLPFKHTQRETMNSSLCVPFTPFYYFLQISAALSATRCKIKTKLKTRFFPLRPRDGVRFQASGFERSHGVPLFKQYTAHVFLFSRRLAFGNVLCALLLIFSILIITKKCVPYVWFGRGPRCQLVLSSSGRRGQSA